MSAECTICTEEIQKNDNSNYVLPCAHVFHPICIRTWLDTSNICPICKHPVNIYTNEQLERYNQRREVNDPEYISEQSREFVSTFINEYVYNIRRDVNIINFDIPFLIISDISDGPIDILVKTFRFICLG